jgi:hypothetical protein
MKAHYERVVRTVCGDNWNSNEVSPDERDGGYGIAVCLAQLSRPSNRLMELAETIGCPPQFIEIAYKRLQINGVFLPNSPILNDPDLQMNDAMSDSEMDRSVKAWCHIAGLASGFIGVGPSRQEIMARRAAR